MENENKFLKLSYLKTSMQSEGRWGVIISFIRLQKKTKIYVKLRGDRF